MIVYLDYASTTPLHPGVMEYMQEVMATSYGNPSSIHRHGREARTIIEKSRRTISQLLNCSIGEIFFTSSATEAHNTLLRRSVQDKNIQRIIYLPLEHHCGIHTIEEIHKDTGIKTVALSVNSRGEINLDELADLLTEDMTTLVSIMHVNNEIGNIYPIKKIAEICREHNAYFHSDTVQSIGKLKLDFTDIGLDMAAGSAHKFYGPKGVGFMYIQNDYAVRPLIYGGAQERNMRGGTENVIGIAGMARAMEIAHQEMEERASIVAARKHYLESSITSELPEARINGSDKRADHISSISFPAAEHVDMLKFNLDIAGISVSSASACSSGIEADSHVLQAIGHPAERKTIRFSFSHLTTEEELDYVMSVLKKHVPTSV